MTSSTRLLPHGGTGIALDIRDDRSHLDDAGRLERLGYDSLWLAGGQLDTLDRAREVVAATETARTVTSIVPLGVHGDDEIARLHHDLQPSGRFVLGLGGPQQERPLPALREHLAALDAAGVPPHERLLAALGPKKIAIARDRSAGAVTLLTSPESTADTRERLGTGSTLAVNQVAVLESDPDRARDAVRPTLGFLLRVAGYRASLGRMGFADDEIDAMSDRLVDAVTAWGTSRRIAERVAAQRDAGADHVALSFFPAEGGAGLMASAEALAEELALAG